MQTKLVELPISFWAHVKLFFSSYPVASYTLTYAYLAKNSSTAQAQGAANATKTRSTVRRSSMRIGTQNNIRTHDTLKMNLGGALVCVFIQQKQQQHIATDVTVLLDKMINLCNKGGDWKCKYGKRKYQVMEYASTENLSTIGKGGKCKYGKRKYRIAWVENASTETGRAILTQKWQKNIVICATPRGILKVIFVEVKQHTQHQSMAEEIQRLQLLERCRKRPTESLRR